VSQNFPAYGTFSMPEILRRLQALMAETPAPGAALTSDGAGNISWSTGGGVGVPTTVLFVDAAAPAGGTGSIASPYDTLQDAFDHVEGTAGSRWQIRVYPGGYAESPTFQPLASKSLEVVGAGEEGETAITGTVTVQDDSGPGQGVFVTFRNLLITGAISVPAQDAATGLFLEDSHIILGGAAGIQVPAGSTGTVEFTIVNSEVERGGAAASAVLAGKGAFIVHGSTFEGEGAADVFALSGTATLDIRDGGISVNDGASHAITHSGVLGTQAIRVQDVVMNWTAPGLGECINAAGILGTVYADGIDTDNTGLGGNVDVTAGTARIGRLSKTDGTIPTVAATTTRLLGSAVFSAYVASIMGDWDLVALPPVEDNAALDRLAAFCAASNIALPGVGVNNAQVVSHSATIGAVANTVVIAFGLALDGLPVSAVLGFVDITATHVQTAVWDGAGNLTVTVNANTTAPTLVYVHVTIPPTVSLP